MNKVNKFLILSAVSLGLVGCIDESSTHYRAKEENENQVQKLQKQTPVPNMERSLERENVAKRLEFINQPNRVGYLYLLTENGQLVREEQVQGKVSSLNSYMTQMDEIAGNSSAGYTTISSPDVDGTWGDNVQGIFWFTPDGVYREWTGKYLFSSERLTFESKPVLIDKNSN